MAGFANANPKEDINRDLDHLETQLMELKIIYDKYFLGMERLEPLRLRTEVQRAVIEMGTRYVRNTGAKYRRDQIKSKYLSYCRYWDRILKQIEEGTYKGHRVKAELHERERLEREAKEARRRGGQAEPENTATMESGPGGAAPATASPAPPPAGIAPRAPQGAPRPNDPVQRIFEQYVAARKSAGESAEGITRDKMAAILQQQAASLKAKYNCSSVEFRVVVEGGKAKLKAVPK
jgi:hypothetical protein